MSLTRLAVFSLLVSFSVALASAQSQPQPNHNYLAVTEDSQAIDSSFNAQDQLLPLLSLTGEPGAQTTSKVEPAEHMGIGPYQAPKTQFDFSNRHRPAPSEAELGMEGYCLAIRSYRVVRDDPHSDSVHRVAYTTCVPAARVHMYTAADVSVDRPESGR
jgi:hypothetical protein